MRASHCLILAAGLFALAGCSKGCREDHPYVPYTIEGSGASPSASADAAAALPTEDAGSAQFREQAAVAAPPGQSQWTVDGVALTAPQGRVFLLGLVRDFDGDGNKDALAVVRAPEKEKTSPGELVFFHGGANGVGAPQSIDSGVELPDDEGCAPSARLSQVGPKSAYVELAIACPNGSASAPSRWVAIVRAQDTATVRFGMTVTDPPGAAKLTIEPDGADIDGDGLDDVTLRVSVEGGSAPFEPGPKVTALLRWFDRPAGLARDVGATEVSFAQLAGVAMARAGRAKDAPAVPLFVAQTRSLFRAVCPEAGGARIALKTGAASMACGQSRALEEADFAEVRAYATMNDPMRAITALERAQRPPATRTAARTNDAQAWIAQLVASPSVKSVRAIAAVPNVARGHSPSWGTLAFEPSGKLLVRTAAGVVRVDPELGDEASADGVAPWKSDVVSADGATQWIEAYDPCDGVALRLTFAPTAKGSVHDVALPIAPPFGPRCTSSRGEPAPAIAVAWGSRGLEAIVAGDPVLVMPDLARAAVLPQPLDQPYAMGAPRSPSGKIVVTPTQQGILVRGGAKPLLVRARELEGTYAQQRDCAVSDDALRVACVRGGKAWVAIVEPNP